MTKPELKQLMNETAIRIEGLRQEYRGEELDDRLRGKLQNILGAKTDEEAFVLAQRAYDTSMVHFLSEWAKGRIPGKPSVFGLEAQIKRAESLIGMLRDKKAPKEQVNSQLERLAALRREHADLLANA